MKTLSALAAAAVATLCLSTPATAGPGDPTPPTGPVQDISRTLIDPAGDVEVTRHLKKHEQPLDSVDLRRVDITVTGDASNRVMSVTYKADDVFATSVGHDYQRFAVEVWLTDHQGHADYLGALSADTNTTTATLATTEDGTACTGTSVVNPAADTVTVSLDANCVATWAHGLDIQLRAFSQYVNYKNKHMSQDRTKTAPAFVL